MPPLFTPVDLSDDVERRRWAAAVSVRWRRVWGGNDRDDRLLRAAWEDDPRSPALSLAAFALECLDRAAWLAWSERWECRTWRLGRDSRPDSVPWRDYSEADRRRWLMGQTIRHALRDLGLDAGTGEAEPTDLPGADYAEAVASQLDAESYGALVSWFADDVTRRRKRARLYLRLADLLRLGFEEPEAWRDGHAGVDSRMGWPRHTTRDLLAALPIVLRDFAASRGASPTRVGPQHTTG